MERLKHMKEMLVSCVQGQMSDLTSTDTKELGEAIDMIKDLSEAIYYCTIVKSMEDTDKEKHNYRDMDRDMGRMYYDDYPKGRVKHPDPNYPHDTMRDYREGQSPLTRKTYMERKTHGNDKTAQMQELEKYMSELSRDLIEMIEDSSVEEKQMLQKKLTALATKIV